MFSFFLTTTHPARAYSGGFALEFDGVTDWAEIDTTRNVIGVDWPTTKSVTLWARPLGTGLEVMDIADGEGLVADHPRWWGIYQADWGGQDRIWIYNHDNSSVDGSPAFRAFGLEYTVGEWMHIAYVQGSGVLRAYKNGVLIESGTIGATAAGHPGLDSLLLRIGSSISLESGGYDGTFHGQIDEVRIYSTELSEDQIRQDMYRSLTGSESGLEAYYSMSNGSGTTITDDTGNGHDATLYDGLGVFVPADGDTAEWLASGAFAGPRNALDFDGTDDFVSVPADIVMPANLTLEAWIYPRNTSAGQKMDRWRERRSSIDLRWDHSTIQNLRWWFTKPRYRNNHSQ